MKTWFLQLVLPVCFLTFIIKAPAQPLAGDYTINAALPTGGTNFQSFGELAAGLHLNGVAGHVHITVAPGSGPYEEQVTFEPIAGTGPDATVTLNGSGETITALTSSTDRHVLRLANLAFFTVENLNVNWNPASSGGFYGIHLYSTGRHILIRNCSVDMSGATSTLYGAYVASGSETSILTSGDFHDITIINNTAKGGGYSASLFGLISDLASNIVIAENAFFDFHSNGVYLRETDGAVIRNNLFDKATPNVTSVNAIQIAQNANVNARIFNNFIQVRQDANGSLTFRGIYLFNGTGHRVYNNVIFNVNLVSGNFTGIEVRTAGTAPEIYFNTISIDNPVGTSGDLAGIKEQLSNTLSVLRNNIISISQPTTGLKAALVLGSTASPADAFDSNHNLFWAPDGNIAQRGTFSPTFYPTFDNWQAVSGQDANSINLSPQFESSILPKPTNLDANDAGITLPGIEVDVLGTLRGTPPDIGAYEFGPCGLPEAPAQILGDTAYCASTGGIAFTVEPVSTASSYHWTLPSGATLVSGQGTDSITVELGATGGDFLVTAVNECGNSDTMVLSLTVFPLPEVILTIPEDTVCAAGNPLVLSGSPEGGSFSGLHVLDGQFIPPDGSGFFTITYTFEDANGCTGAATDSVLVLPCIPNATEEPARADLILFPNPATETITIRGLPPGDYQCRLRTAAGRTLLNRTLRGDSELNLAALPAGIYFLELYNGQERWVKRILKQ